MCQTTCTRARGKSCVTLQASRGWNISWAIIYMRTREGSQSNTWFSGLMHTGDSSTKRVTAANQKLVLVAVEVCKMVVFHEECSAHRTHTCVMLQAYREYIPCASHATRASDRSQSNTVFNGFGFMHVAIFQSIWHRHEAGQDDTRVRSQPMCNITRALKVVQECAVSLCAILREPWGWYYKSVH
jgi:hypothetical protein